MDKVRTLRIDPTKHFQSEVHNLIILIERANDTNDNTMPDKNILAKLYEEISEDPREALRITALNSACFCRSSTHEQDRQDSYDGIKNNSPNLFLISGK